MFWPPGKFSTRPRIRASEEQRLASRANSQRGDHTVGAGRASFDSHSFFGKEVHMPLPWQRARGPPYWRPLAGRSRFVSVVCQPTLFN